ncbi:uncharacterized protein FRV6_16450 [Fusarium oxysporum]|uniref:Uncharacterized protein n=1 Tax=Fusarium oxysporum TaxID=5507 RepID=A0A2H3TUN3_FUSOX|nr:uncharacterized protein FRV6_16450 [Fusarium oxysporum]
MPHSKMEHTWSPFAWEGFFLGPLVVRLLDLSLGKKWK